ncbi:MAG: HPr family phosphocarrier protein [Firmicutes bacterium]|nr:HPr family phosphocarrier protein [Bacillota bacterium]
MLNQEVTIRKKAITSRDNAALVQRAMKFESEIYFEQPSKRINGKSLMGVISLGLKDGDKIIVSAKGADEADAIRELTALLKNGFI